MNDTIVGTHSLLNWQRRKNIKERNEIMFEQELATDVSFAVSYKEGGKLIIRIKLLYLL